MCENYILLTVNDYTFSGSSSAVFLFSLSGRSSGRAIVLPPALALAAAASALAKSLTLKFFM